MCRRCRAHSVDSGTGKRVCTRCKRELPFAEFRSRQRGAEARPRPACRGCEAARYRAYQARQRLEKPEEVRAKKNAWSKSNKWSVRRTCIRTLCRSFGWEAASIEEVVRLAQAIERCEICGRLPREAGVRNGFLSIDHNHATGEFRGFLCGPCNLGMGHFGDSAERLARAVEYLERSAGRHAGLDGG